MALGSWNNQQILAQLDSGTSWSGNTITYAFPTTIAGIYGTDEHDGFTPLTAAQKSAATLALQLWDDLITPNFQYTTSTTSDIEFGSSNTGVSYAHAYFPEEGSVWFNRGYAELTSPMTDSYGFMTYIHETGHALGLEHMGDYNGEGATPSCYQDSSVYSLMSYFGPDHWDGQGDVAWADWIGTDGMVHSPQTPMLNDIMAIQSMYGVDSTTRTGDTTYGFNSNISGNLASIYDFSSNLFPILTIFDSAGIDTLDLSGWTSNSIIHLEAGSYSACNAMTYNIAIAYGCTIENAIGGSGDDVFYGNGANNYLNGGAGNDTIVLSGSLSSYSISFDNLNVSISGADIGTDLFSNIEWCSFADGIYSLSQLLGDTGFSLQGTAANDTLKGTEGADRLFGQEGIDKLYGYDNDDYLDGGLGADKMKGGNGNDTYIVDDASDKTSESATSGTNDEVYSSVDYTLGKHIEAFFLTGTSALNGTGSSTDNAIYGNIANNVLLGLAGNDQLDGDDGDDLLNGGKGNDVLHGGNGSDHFRFDTKPNALTNHDIIDDFLSGVDVIELENATFKKLLATGQLSAGNFVANATGTALDADDYLIYNTTTGSLYYDTNGNGTGKAVEIVNIAGVPELSASDFLIT